MKKFLCSITVITMFGVFNINAQDIKFGAKGGINFASGVADDDDFDIDGRTNFHIGGVVNFSISEDFSIQPELLFSGQGAEIDGEELALSYINVPIMADYEVFDNFSVQAGPQIGFNISAEVDDEDVSEFIETVDFGLGFGAQYELESGLFFQGRLMFGITDVIEDTDGSNQVFSLSVGYMFN